MTGRLALLLIAAGLLAGCAASAPPPPAVVAARPVDKGIAGAELAAGWKVRTARAPGFSVELPGEPWEVSERQETKEGTITIAGLAARSGPGQAVAYRVVRTQLPVGYQLNEDILFKNAEAALARVDGKRRILARGARGLEVEGLTERGTATLVRVLVAGAGAYTLAVEAPPDRLDRGGARRFFESFAIVTPWRVFASPEGHATVAVPDTWVEIDKKEPSAQGEIRTRSFCLEVADGPCYGLVSFDLPAERLRAASPDVILRDAANGFAKRDGLQVETTQTVREEGLSGLELFAKLADGSLARVRLHVGSGRLYVLTVGGKDRRVLDDADARRFLGSLQIGQRAPAEP